jgi:hypothetical protein
VLSVLQAPIVAFKFVIVHGLTAQDAGAVYDFENVHAASAENLAVMLHELPLAGKLFKV